MYNKEAQARYVKDKTKTYTIRVYKNTEPDILQKLESTDNINGYIKGLIRQDISRQDGSK